MDISHSLFVFVELIQCQEFFFFFFFAISKPFTIYLVQIQLIYGFADLCLAAWGPGEPFLCLFTQSDLGAAVPRRVPWFFPPTA